MVDPDLDKLTVTLTPKKRLGKYVLLGRIGHGGMGKIYLAYLPGPAGIEKLLVIKRLHNHLTGDPVLVQNFLDEARLSMALTHPNIVQTYDVGDLDGRYFMVMEHADGHNLGVVLKTAKRRNVYPSSTLFGGLFVDVLDALHAAHIAVDARGRPLNIIHRDVSPQNILISYDGTPKLLDFGIAKAAMRMNETDAGVLKGKYAYMSPEQCETKELDARSDVFSAGVVFWEMLAGKRLYKSDSILRSVERILREPPVSPVEVNASCSPQLAKVALKALSKKRDDRFRSAEEFRDAVDDAIRFAEPRFRKADVRSVMENLFGDVRAKQQTLLEEALSGSSVPAPDVERNDVDDEKDSASDLQVPHLSGVERESTTPSVSLSPLQTGERGDVDEDEVFASTAPRVPTFEDNLVTDPNMAPNDAVTALAPAASSGGVVIEEPKPERRRAASFVLIALLIGVGTFLVLSSFVDTLEDPRVPDIVVATPTPPIPPESTTKPIDPLSGDAALTPKPDEGPMNKPGPATNGAAPPTSETAPDVVDRRPKEAVSGPGEQKPETPDSEPSSGLGEPAKVPATNKNEGTEKDPEKTAKKSSTTKGAAKPKEPIKTAVDPAPSTKVIKTFGYLTLDTVPWTDVFLDGKKLGETPLVRKRVPTGPLRLRVVNKLEEVDEEVLVTIVEGATTAKRLSVK